MNKYCFAFALSVMSVTAIADLSVTTANNGNLLMQGVPEISEQIVHDLNQYQNIRSAPFRGFSRDSKSLYVSTRFADVSQIHRVDMAGGARHQLTFFKEPIGQVSRQPGGDKVLFTMDVGGSEYTQIFELNTQSGKSKMLSDGKSRNRMIVWSNDGSKVAYQSTKRNGASNDLWVMDVNHPENTELVLESPDGSWWGVSDWSSNDKTVLLGQYISAADSRVYLLNLVNKEKRLLLGSNEETTVNYAYAFDANDKGFFYTTNQFSEFEQLAYRSLHDETIKVITSDIQWNVGGFAISDQGDKAAFSVNADGIDVLYLLDTKSFRYEKVAGLPLGLLGGLEFSADGRKLGMTLNTAHSPSDSFVLSLGQSPLQYTTLERWTFSEIGGLNSEAFTDPKLIHFNSFDQRKIPAFVYKPKSKGPHPVIISIHGGPEGQFRPAFQGTFQLWIDQLGVAVIAPNVRGSSGYGKEYLELDNGFNREDSVNDIGALLDWIETQPDLDQNRVAVIGGSYGGYMVLASAVHFSKRLKAAVDIVGISNFVTFLENTESYRRDLRRAEYGDERDEKMRAHLLKISPVNHVSSISVPIFVVQGQNDPRVPVSEAEQMVTALQQSGKKVWYMNALNEGHGYQKKENRSIYEQAVVLFFKEFLL